MNKIRLLFSQWRKATEKHIKGRWYGGKHGEYFRCVWCGHRFQLNDEYNVVLTNVGDYYHHIHGNPLVCKKCYKTYGDELIEELEYRAYILYKDNRYWWFLKNKED